MFGERLLSGIDLCSSSQRINGNGVLSNLIYMIFTEFRNMGRETYSEALLSAVGSDPALRFRPVYVF
jgi:hypothetical protein